AARVQAARDLSLRAFVERLLAGDEGPTAAVRIEPPEAPPTVITRPVERFSVAAKCGAEMRFHAPPAEGGEPIGWMRERVETLCTEGMRGPLYVFLPQPPDRAVAEALRWVVSDHRVEPAVVAAGTVSRAHLELLRHSGVRALYVT